MATLLEDITSGDAQRIWASSCAIAKTRDLGELEFLASHIAEIQRATNNVQLGGALFPNREHLDFAMLKLQYVRAKSGCLCRLYPKYLLFNPNTEAEAGNVRLISVSSTWGGFYQCECSVCDTRFKVEEGEYHYTWWQWNITEPRPLARAN